MLYINKTKGIQGPILCIFELRELCHHSAVDKCPTTIHNIKNQTNSLGFGVICQFSSWENCFICCLEKHDDRIEQYVLYCLRKCEVAQQLVMLTEWMNVMLPVASYCSRDCQQYQMSLEKNTRNNQLKYCPVAEKHLKILDES